MHIRARQGWIAVALLTLAVPVWAHTDKAQLSVTDKASIGGTQLKPGDYSLEVKDNGNQLKVVDINSGKTVVQVAIQWVPLKNKPDSSTVIMDGDQVTEVDFGGKTQGVRFSGNSSNSGN